MNLLPKFSSSLLLWQLIIYLWTPPPAVALCDCELNGTSGNTMKCSGCSQHDLPQTLRPTVRRLVLTGNRLTRLIAPPGSESALGRLTVISADNNDISELREGDSCSFSMLRVLDLSHNNIQVVEGRSISCNHHLKRLVLSDNPNIQLRDMQSDSLTHLFLDRCDLRSLDRMNLVGLSSLKQLYIRGNPMLNCDATTRNLHELMPHLSVHCDSSVTTIKMKTTTGASSNSATSASPKSLPSNPAIPRKLNNIPDHPIQDTLSSQQLHDSLDINQYVAIILAGFIILILLIFILFVIFLLHVKCRNEFEIGAAHGKPFQDTC